MHLHNNSIYSVLILLLVVLFYGCRKDETNVVFELPSNVIHKIVTDKYGTKWIATEKGVVCFDGEKWNPYPDIPFENNKLITDLAISPMEGNEIWLAGNQGVSFMKFNPGDILVSGKLTANENELLSDIVTAVAVDTSNVKYFGTSMGLSIYSNELWTAFTGRSTEQILAEFPITSIAAAKNGWIYAATYGGGVSRFKYTDAVSGATTFDSDWSGLRSNYVNDVIIVDDTCQWYGTNNGAAFHSSHITKSLTDWVKFSKADGLISDTVLSIAQDANGNVWFGTNAGVCRLSDHNFTSFTVSDGLISNKVSAISIDTDGSVWFGTDKGISHYKNSAWINYSAE